MTKHRIIAVAFIVLCVPFIVTAQSTNSNSTLVDRVIETMTLANKVSQLPTNFTKRFKRNPFQLSKEANKRWLQSFKESYNKKRLMQDYRQIFKQKLNNLSTEKIAQWLHQPSTQKLTQARQERYTLQGKRKSIIALYELDQDPPSKERQQLLGAYAEAITPGDVVIESSITVFKSVIKSIGKVSSRLNFTDSQIGMIVSNFRQQKPNYTKKLKEQSLPVKFYDVSSETIQQSLAFWETDTGQELAKAIYTSLQQTYEKAAKRLTTTI